jgi:benzil reductase ((S)-benzoin forming)
MAEKIAVVTGHSRGLGEGIASHLLAQGIPVLGLARQRNVALAKRFGAALTEAQLDLADAAAVQRWLATDALGPFVGEAKLAMLVNNAGVLQPIGPLEVQDVAAVARAVAVNVGAVLVLSAAFAARTTRVRDRRILHVSSGAGSNPYAGWSVYCATKAALDHHARATALDRSPGLRVGSVAPGVIDTEMQTEIRSTTDAKFPDRHRFIELKEKGRLRDADEAGAEVVKLLLSDAFAREPVTDLRRG